jgi:hypothetical protein
VKGTRAPVGGAAGDVPDGPAGPLAARFPTSVGLSLADRLDGAVIWIDSKSNEPEEPISLGGSPQSLVFGDGALWVADAFNRMVTRIEL